MPAAPIPLNEADRMRALLEYDILDSPAEASFDRITRMVSEVIRVPIVLVSFVDTHRQWFKSRHGFDATESSRDSAFCAHTILGDGPVVVPDARFDPRFSDSPLVVGNPFIRFYAGVPLKSAGGYNLGTLCAICLEPRELAACEIDLLVEFAAVVSGEMALRLALKHVRDGHARLLQSEKMAVLGQFAARIAHEINTPVHFLGGTTDFLQESFSSLTTLVKAYELHRKSGRLAPHGTRSARELDALIQEHDIGYLLEEVPLAIDHARAGIARITDLVSSMKTYAHPSPSTHLPADINEAIRTTAVISSSEWRPHCAMDLDLAPGLPPLSCNISEIYQALLNIIVNASQAVEERLIRESPPPGALPGAGRIHIASAHADGVVFISIRDNGAGIPREILSKIYDPAFTTKPAGKGTGQGLAIVRDIIVTKHRGSIDALSEPGMGTVFLIRLPVQDGFAVPAGNSIFEAAPPVFREGLFRPQV